jgi:hypothetical protein
MYMKKSNRREFIATTAIAGAAAASPALANSLQAGKKQLLHHVFFWLKNPDSLEDRSKLIEGLRTLAGIETIKALHIGVLASTEKREVVDTSWQVSELMFFDDAAGQKVYQDHAIHEAFVKNYSHLWSKVVVYDAMDV